MGEMIDWNKYMQSSDGEKMQMLKEGAEQGDALCQFGYGNYLASIDPAETECLKASAMQGFMVADKTVVARYQKVVDKYNAELGVTEQVKRFVLVADAWTEANKMLTPTQKLIRRNVEAAYREQIDALFK